MPAVPLFFRSSCGCFVAIFIHFMFRRAEKGSVEVSDIEAQTRLHGVVVGLPSQAGAQKADPTNEFQRLQKCGHVFGRPGSSVISFCPRLIVPPSHCAPISLCPRLIVPPSRSRCLVN
ncbi:hypothetical protein ACOMHN_020549 [Nucella lapillus]